MQFADFALDLGGKLPTYENELHAVTSMMDGVMYVGGDNSYMTPLTWLCKAQLAFKHARQAAAQKANIEWLAEGELRLISADCVTTVSSMADLLDTSISEAERYLQRLLLPDPPPPGSTAPPASVDLPVPPLPDIYDDKSNMTLAYSFMDHPKNKSWVELCCVELFGRLDSHPQRATEWTNGSRINPNAIRTYLNIRQDFLSALSVAIYLTAGQPPRRTEEQILRWRNTSLGGMRNVIVCSSTVAIRSLWYKKRHTLEEEIPVWRFLPRRLARMLVLYLVGPLQLCKCLERCLEGEYRPLSAFLFSKQVLEQPPAVGNAEPEPSRGPGLDSRSKASLLTPDVLLTKPLRRLTAQVWGGPGITPAKYRHIGIAYAKRYLHGMSIEAMLGLDDTASPAADADEDAETTVAVIDRQASHGSLVARMVYAVEWDTGEKFNMFFKVSTMWHQLFGQFPTSAKRSREQSDSASNDVDRPALDKQIVRLEHLKAAATTDNLRALFHNNSIVMHDFQKQVFEAMEKHDKIVLVQGTGSGKSVTFALPGYIQPEAITVVVLPTKVLQELMYKHLSGLKVNCIVWDSASPNPVASIILITVETLNSRPWKGFVRRHTAGHIIDRVIVDEAQEVLMADHDWRRKFLTLRASLDPISPRQIYMTGTLPPSMQDTFLQRLNFGPGNAPCILRSKTARDNLRYEYADRQLDVDVPASMTHFVELFDSVRAEGRRGILFCMSESECSLTSAALGLPKYYRNLPPAEKAASLQEWETFKGGICATTAMAWGVDIPLVSVVVCLGAYDKVTMLQQFGRAGRDGSPAVVILAYPLSRLTGDLRKYAVAPCKREDVSLFLDGSSEKCGCHHNACGGCLRAPQPTQPLQTPTSRTGTGWDRSSFETVDYTSALSPPPGASAHRTPTRPPRHLPQAANRTGRTDPRSQNLELPLPTPSSAHMRDNTSSSKLQDPETSLAGVSSPARERSQDIIDITDDPMDTSTTLDNPEIHRESGADGTEDDVFKQRRLESRKNRELDYIESARAQIIAKRNLLGELEKLRDFIKYINTAGPCTCCLMSKRGRQPHYLRNCSESTVERGILANLTNCINPQKTGVPSGMSPNTGCFSCGLPKDWCDKWDDNGIRPGGKCSNKRTF